MSHYNKGPCGCTKTTICDPCTGKPVVKEIRSVSGISTAVIDDANELTYLYGNVMHENFHVPTSKCQPYVAVPSTWETWKHFMPTTEVYEGTFADNTIILTETPSDVRPMFVFLNGVHQDEGQTYDYIIEDEKKIKFMTHTLLPSDRVTVKFYYVKVGY